MDNYFLEKSQHVGELDEFIDVLKRENVKSYLEIGSKFGGSLWRIGSALPPGSRIVSVDLPHGKRESQPHLERCVSALTAKGYDARLLLGDSTDPAIITNVEEWGPYDCVFIDANHTLHYVTQDWMNYGPMGRLVAFHDIGWIARPPPSNKMPIEVPFLWNKIKDKYKHLEIRKCERDNGIGVLWMR